jgi:hypothetical protein
LQVNQSARSRCRSVEHRLRSAARSAAMVTAEAIEPVAPTRRLGIGRVARRSVNWYRTERWHISSQASFAWSGRLNRLLAGSSALTPKTKRIRCHTKRFIAVYSSYEWVIEAILTQGNRPFSLLTIKAQRDRAATQRTPQEDSKLRNPAERFHQSVASIG